MQSSSKKRRSRFAREHGRFIRIENDFKYWELDECLHQWLKMDSVNPVHKNLEFFIPLQKPR